MSEKNDYKILRAGILQRYDRLDRIENTAVNGMPDLNYCSKGVEVWIEQKSAVEPKRPSSKLLASNHRLSQSQMNWFLRQRQAGGKAYILIVTNIRWMLIDGAYADGINDMTVQALVMVSEWWELRPVTQPGWEALRSILNGFPL